jgi:rubrerythrin
LSKMTLEQAVRDALEAERFAALFYDELADLTDDRRAVGFFASMAAQERRHAERVQELGERLGAEGLADHAVIDVSHVETTVGWQHLKDITYRDALHIALQAEQAAVRFYRTMSELLDGEASILFAELAADELGHVAKLEVIRGGASREQLSRDIPRGMLGRRAPGDHTRRT